MKKKSVNYCLLKHWIFGLKVFFSFLMLSVVILPVSPLSHLMTYLLKKKIFNRLKHVTKVAA